MRVAVVIVNYGQWDLTREALRSLREAAGVDLRVTLVDNCSPGEVPAWVGESPDVRFERLAENTGFAGGNNAGFRMSREDGADYTFFLNNDARVAPDAVEALAGFLETHGEAGIAAPAVYRASEPGRLWSAGGNLVRWKMRFEQVAIPVELFHTREGMSVDFVSGCALMIRSRLFEELGGFREEMFMYYEDADLCHRVRESGFTVMVVPSAMVVHDVASSSGGELSRLALYFSERNRLALSRRMLHPLFRSVFILYKTAVLLVLTAKFLVLGNPGLIRWMWRGYLDGIAGRTGYREVIGRLV
ncbi:MAG: glycosyltransferase family 2 protein [Candidatus Fermentibacteraceae bacterium]|nr:glycosyltransferase family 2 protein [Candidatus Fermentibacteraceae bacterium]MBN2609228.1 glycosyltransferase family 2 protein [Candidatus Fermentibacteraceae bacterium]